MAVVLGEVTHAQEAVERAARLVAVQQARLGVAHRQVAVGVPGQRVELAVAGAVHRLDRDRPAFGLGDEHVLAVLVPVPGGLPQRAVVELWGLDLGVAAGLAHLAAQLHELVVDARAGRQPERRAWRDLREREQAELGSQPAVVVGARALEPFEVLLEIASGEERGAVDAREHWIACVAAPVRTRDRLELEGLDPLRARRVRAPAEIREGPVGVQRDGVDVLVCDEVLDQLHLVVLALGEEAFEPLHDRDVPTDKRLVRGDVLAHACLDALEVRLGQRAAIRELEVVIETVLDRWADRDLDPRVELHHCARQHMGRVVTNQRQRLRAALLRDHREPAAPRRQGAREIPYLAVDRDGEGRPRETGPDRGGGIGAGRVIGQGENSAVGELVVHRAMDPRGAGTFDAPGRLAQLGERRLDKAEVAGSSPASSTPVVTGDSPTSGHRRFAGCVLSASLRLPRGPAGWPRRRGRGARPRRPRSGPADGMPGSAPVLRTPCCCDRAERYHRSHEFASPQRRLHAR